MKERYYWIIKYAIYGMAIHIVITTVPIFINAQYYNRTAIMENRYSQEKLNKIDYIKEISYIFIFPSTKIFYGNEVKLGIKNWIIGNVIYIMSSILLGYIISRRFKNRIKQSEINNE